MSFQLNFGVGSVRFFGCSPSFGCTAVEWYSTTQQPHRTMYGVVAPWFVTYTMARALQRKACCSGLKHRPLSAHNRTKEEMLFQKYDVIIIMTSIMAAPAWKWKLFQRNKLKMSKQETQLTREHLIQMEQMNLNSSMKLNTLITSISGPGLYIVDSNGRTPKGHTQCRRVSFSALQKDCWWLKAI